MTKERKETLATTIFALELLKRIPSRGKIVASALHKELQAAGFDESLRTIQRHLDALSKHFPIERDDSSKPYGYRWQKDPRSLFRPSLTPEESLLFRLAEQNLRNLLPANAVAKSMQGFFEQAASNLAYELNPNEKKKLAREWLSKVCFVRETVPLLPPEIKPGVLDEVSNALYHNRWLNIDYKNREGEQQTADVMPLAIGQRGLSLYLVCRYEESGSEYLLALHRFLSAKMSTLRFNRPQDFSLNAFVEEGRFQFGKGDKVALRFRTTPEVGALLTETPLSKDQKIKTTKGGKLEIRATVPDTPSLAWWLFSYGDNISHISMKQVKAKKDKSRPRSPKPV